MEVEVDEKNLTVGEICQLAIIVCPSSLRTIKNVNNF
jgi:hypothetical protein